MSILNYFRPSVKKKLMRGERVNWIQNNSRSRYLKQCVLSFPPWVSKKDLLKLWKECRRLEKVHGVPYSLDHIVPLNHPYVCGLTVPWNLVPTPVKVNGFKSNKFHPDQIELLNDKEQLKLL